MSFVGTAGRYLPLIALVIIPIGAAVWFMRRRKAKAAKDADGEVEVMVKPSFPVQQADGDSAKP